MAGGTGGHIFPGLAVAEVLAGRGWRVVWMGLRTGMEAEIVPRNGYEMVWVNFQGVRGKGIEALIAAPLRLLRAMWQAAAAIRRVKPDVVLGMGGYVALPGGLMASLLNRPLVIHEQNAVAGTTTRLLAAVADRVLTSFESAFKPRQRALLTGNPIRSVFTDKTGPAERFARREGRLRLTVLGGSLGAKALNEIVPQALALLPEAARPEVTHQTGRQHVGAVRAAYAQVGVQARCESFIEDMAAQLEASDLVVCRAGATTLAELAALGVASILVPFPHAIDDHQTRNAQALAGAGASILVPQAELTPDRLAGVLRSLDRPRLLEMACRARSLGRPQAAREVADVCEQMAAGQR
ncbi:MAG: undecaprenyldiphospho-muramoylpentapeptide beta-N-acetylglucosaminyltransferase [Betaproteobacteria bacterium]|nr:MAG: undecaprenyldiphospho-muramoylpentapeptide beta-N-acetylglucosaminyltransferase [Betaproteobacteria bacterium]